MMHRAQMHKSLMLTNPGYNNYELITTKSFLFSLMLKHLSSGKSNIDLFVWAARHVNFWLDQSCECGAELTIIMQIHLAVLLVKKLHAYN